MNNRTRETVLPDLQVDTAKGIVTAFGERVLIMPVKFVHSIEDQLFKTFGPIPGANFLYEMGREAGKHSAALVAPHGSGIDVIRDRRLSKELAPLWGWGGLVNVELDFRNMVARSQRTNSIFVRDRTGKSPVCHYIRGLEAGAFEIVFGRECESIEVLCEGKGNPNCELVTGKSVKIARLAESLDGTTAHGFRG